MWSIGINIIVACWATFLIFWLFSAFFYSGKRVVEGKSLGWWRFIILAVIALFISISNRTGHSGYLYFLGERFWAPALSVLILADILAVLSIAILMWARVTLGTNWSSRVVFRERHELITSGPYAYVRHPIYSGVILLAIASAIAFADMSAVIVLAIAIIFSSIRVFREERLMTKHFPNEYPEYMRRTKRLIPFIF